MHLITESIFTKFKRQDGCLSNNAIDKDETALLINPVMLFNRFARIGSYRKLSKPVPKLSEAVGKIACFI